MAMYYLTITYIKVTHEIVYGFAYGIECDEGSCFIDFSKAKDCTDERNYELKRWENI